MKSGLEKHIVDLGYNEFYLIFEPKGRTKIKFADMTSSGFQKSMKQSKANAKNMSM